MNASRPWWCSCSSSNPGIFLQMRSIGWCICFNAHGNYIWQPLLRGLEHPRIRFIWTTPITLRQCLRNGRALIPVCTIPVQSMWFSELHDVL
jgi:hypothetical protein